MTGNNPNLHEDLVNIKADAIYTNFVHFLNKDNELKPKSDTNHGP